MGIILLIVVFFFFFYTLNPGFLASVHFYKMSKDTYGLISAQGLLSPS